jgi:hypothetical protein
MANGLGRVDSARLANISYETFTVWMEKHPEFTDAIKTAEARFEEWHLGNIKKAAKTKWVASAWILERKYPEKYALRVAHTNADGGNINFHAQAVLWINQFGKGGDVNEISPPDGSPKQIGSSRSD